MPPATLTPSSRFSAMLERCGENRPKFKFVNTSKGVSDPAIRSGRTGLIHSDAICAGRSAALSDWLTKLISRMVLKRGTLRPHFPSRIRRRSNLSRSLSTDRPFFLPQVITGKSIAAGTSAQWCSKLFEIFLGSRKARRAGVVILMLPPIGPARSQRAPRKGFVRWPLSTQPNCTRAE